jgi:type VI secretion system secreted protein VgrG
MSTVTLSGTNHDADAVTQGAKNDLQTAYTDAAGRTPVTNVPVELGGSTLLPGVYTSPTFGLTGTLTLDAQGDPNAEFIFQAGSTVITASNSRVRVINGAQACNVVWQVGSSATFGTGTNFVGDVLSHTSITAQTGATFHGRLLASDGAVTLDTNTITASTCSAVTQPTATGTPATTATAKPSPTGTATASGVGTGGSAGSSGATGSGRSGGDRGSGPVVTRTPGPTGTSETSRSDSTLTRAESPSLPLTGLPVIAATALAIALLLMGTGLSLGARHRHGGGRHQA